MAERDGGKATGKGNAALLQEIRDRYRYAVDAWKDTRAERAVDLRYICGDPWDPKDKAERKENGRPAINHDELGQYVNQGVNGLRQSKRGIKMEPRGGPASTEKTAELHEDIARTVEYKSRALDAYLRAAQDMYEGSYGFFRLGRRYVVDNPADDDPRAFDQECTIGAISNPDSVLYSPDFTQPDWSDAGWCFILNPVPIDDFKRDYPEAEKTDFTSDDIKVAPQWITDKTILVAEYWKIIVKQRKIKRGSKSRTVDEKRLVQYITNGVEILDEIEQPGTEIPIIPMVGLERYVDDGGRSVRKLFSLVRLAREPQMSLAYLNSQEIEEAGLSPKVPVRGWTGQFETDQKAHSEAHKVPHAYLQYDYPDWAKAAGIQLALPVLDQFVPNFQQFELAKDSARRAIQASMGISPLPTAAQRDSEKSGVALERIDTQESVGSYHFVAGYDRAVARAGRILDSWIPVVYDTEREESLRKPDDSNRLVKLNTPAPYANERGDLEHYPVSEESQHNVAVSTGPSFQSQYDAVSDFLDHLIEQLPKLPIPPPQAQKLLALAIQMKQMGPKGDQMAEIISPPDNGRGAQQLSQMQASLQQAQELIQKLTAEVQELNLQRQAKVIETAGKKDIEQMKLEAQVLVAEITTKAQDFSQRMDLFMDLAKQLHAQVHERQVQAADQQHQQGMAQQQQAAQQQTQQAQQQAQPQGPSGD